MILEFWARPNPIIRKWSLNPLPEKLKSNPRSGWIVDSEMVMKKKKYKKKKKKPNMVIRGVNRGARKLVRTSSL